MTLFDRPIGPETYAAIRFGCGLPLKDAPTTAAGMLARLTAADRMAAAYPGVRLDALVTAANDFRELRRRYRRGERELEDQVSQMRRDMKFTLEDAMVNDLIRTTVTDDPFRERLARFWGDHFTTSGFPLGLFGAPSAHVEEAIRPNMTGRFADLLIAAVTHPVMLLYLDQVGSVGPNSAVGLRRGLGLNENLAREVLELHTLGVGGPYSQDDVTQLAELLTGLHFSLKDGFRFRRGLAEPGAEEVLDARYGGVLDARLDDIHEVLEDIAVHPATADHIARKLAVHFVSDDPDPALVAAMTGAFRDSGGDLLAVYTAMLDHPAAWRDFGAKVKQPFDYISSGVRAMGVRPDEITGLRRNQMRRFLLRPMHRMGQAYLAAPGPDGWPEEPEAWIHPHGLAARIAWAMEITRARRGDPPDPRAFVEDALGEAASGRLIWAAGAAETRAQGVGIVLASAEFNRR